MSRSRPEAVAWHHPEPQAIAFPTLISDIEKGLIKIPQFQRDFVWTKEKSAKLLDSIIKGFPVGTIIIWKTKETLRSVRDIGGAKLPTTPEGDATEYILDGQQRLTSLFASIKGLKIERDGVHHDFNEIFVDLAASEDEEIVKIEDDKKTTERIYKAP
jgi:uncharacterized protein with ParB-like and HNH nuclease domain